MGIRLRTLRFIGLYLLAALCVSWPALTRLNTVLIGRMGGDNYEHVWYLWWLAQTLFERIGSPATIPLLNHPSGVYSPLNLTHTPVLFLPAILGHLTTPATAYNLAMLLVPVLNASGMYWLALELTASRRAAVLGGLLFGFSPHMLGHQQAGHLSLITVVGFPLFTLFLLRLIRRPTWQRTAATSLSAFLAAAHPSHLAYFVLPTTLILLVAARSRLRNPKVCASILAAALLTITMLAPFYIPLLTSHEAITTRSLELGDSVGKSMDLASFITPASNNPFLPAALQPFAARVVTTADETHGYLGLVALGLAVFGVVTRHRAIAHWTALAGGALLLSMGPVLKLAGNLPGLLIDGIAHPVQLPYSLIAQLPLFAWSRTPARFGATLHFALAILATYGLAALLARLHHQGRAALLVSALCITAFAERLISWPMPTAPASSTTTFRTITTPNSQRAVLNLPPSFTSNNLALYAQTLHEQPILGGHIFRGNSETEHSLYFLDSLLRPPTDPDIIPQPDRATARAAILAAYDVGTVVNQHWAESYDPAQRDFLISEFGTPAATNEINSIFFLEDYTELLPDLTFSLHPSDWGKPELWGDLQTRWFADTARLYIYSAYAQTGRMQITTVPGLQLHRIEISLNNIPVTTVIVGDSATYSTPTVTIPSGLSILTFTDLDGAETVWGDLRCVGVTPLAGKLPGQLDCDEHLKGERQLSAAIQNVLWLQQRQPTPALGRFGKRIELTEAQLPKVSRGAELVLPLTFHALTPVGADLTLFVHVFGPLESGVEDTPALLSQWDGWPLRGNFATSGWNPRGQLGFRVRVPVPAGAIPGEYRVELGWYDSASGSRLHVSEATRETHDNVLVLGNFVLSEK